MSNRAWGSRTALLSLAFCVSAALSGCGGGGDSSSAAAGPVSQQPVAPSPDPPSANAAPTISGATVQSVNADTAYAFTPSANDADGDTLSFQIANKPTWATFSTVTGALSGTPTPAHAGSYANVSISVSDGKASASLPPFSIDVVQAVIDGDTLSWTAPTQNEDGSAITDLAGFTIVFGSSPTVLHRSVRVANPTVDRYVFDSLQAGTYYFAVRAYTATGVQSPLSNVVSKVFQ
jgi:Putative Ig domain